MTAERSYQFSSAAPPAKPVAVDTPGVRAAARPRAQVYWFHSDHLGTGTLITDLEGRPHQFFLNLPYGETFIEQGGYRHNNPYKFNGKELDEETGLYYYGARYYDPKVSVFLSVDPIASKFPFQSPYVYAAANPIRFMDINGLGPGDSLSVAKANALINQFAANPNTTSVFPHISKEKLISDLRARVASGGVEIQQSTNTCGLAAVAHVFASADPEGYVKFILDLYQTGAAKWNNYEITAGEGVANWAKNAKPQGRFDGADLVLIGSLRYVENVPNRFTPGTMDGMTWPSEISRLLEDLVGLKSLSPSLVTAQTFHKYDQQIQAGKVYAIMLHAGWLNGGIFDPWHYSVYEGNSTINGSQFTYDLWDYGKIRPFTTSLRSFNWSIIGGWIYSK